MVQGINEILDEVQCFCGNPKRMQHPFCSRCYNALPPASRTFVTYIKNYNFRGTYEAAREYLEKHYANQSQ